MDKELKIVVSIFLVFLLYGAYAFFANGSFATPVFLNQLILFGVSVAFYISNRKLKYNKLLLIYIFVQLLALLMDGFTIGFLSDKLEVNLLMKIHESVFLNITFISIYFLFFYFLVFWSDPFHKSKLMFWGQIICLATSTYLFFVPDLAILRDVSFFIFIILFVTAVNRFEQKENQALKVISYQMLLLFLLEGMEYFL